MDGRASDPEALRIVSMMYDNDRFSQLLGIRILRSEKGSCTLSMKIRDDMVNGFGIVHGGVTFSLADSAFAFASNAHGRISVALETSMSYPAPVHVGDTLTAIAVEMSLTNRIGIYHITVTNQDGTVVGLFKGTVYRTSREHKPMEVPTG